MDASDPIRPSENSCGTGAVHIWVPAPRRTAEEALHRVRDTSLLSTHFPHQRVRDLEIRIDVLHVVLVVERVDQLEHLLALLVVDG